MNTLFDLTGTVALITGGNSGIGIGMARGLAAHGADIAIWGTNPEKNAAATAELAATGRRVHAEVCDVGDHEAVVAAFAATVSALGRVDSCFVNAGVSSRARSFASMPPEEWRRVMQVNLDGAFSTAQCFVNHAVERGGGGSVVFTTSGSAFFGQQKGQNYGGSKAGLIALMKGIAVEHARDGIRANAILPGWVMTDLASPALTWDRFVEKNLPRVPMRRWGDPDDFAGIAVYLASRAAAYHTGDVITIDGGYHSF